MNIQEQEEMDFNRMSPFEFEEAAVKQEGYLRPAAQYLLTDYDTWVPNPFWDGVTVQDFSEAAGEGQYEDDEVAGESAATRPVEPTLPDDGLPF